MCGAFRKAANRETRNGQRNRYRVNPATELVTLITKPQVNARCFNAALTDYALTDGSDDFCRSPPVIQGRMPEDGVDILEGIACGCTLKEVGADLGIGMWAVKGRMDTMRRVFRARMVELGILPSMQSLRVVVSLPMAIETLQMAA